MQISSETNALYIATIADLGVTVQLNRGEGLPLVTIADYIEVMRVQLWDTAFYNDFQAREFTRIFR